MEIKDGGFKIKTKKLSKEIQDVINAANDSSIASSIKGSVDIEDAQALVKEIQLAVDLLSCQMENIKQGIKTRNNPFNTREK